MRILIVILCCIALLPIGGVVCAQVEPKTEASTDDAAGRRDQLTFEERSPLSSVQKVTGRFRATLNNPPGDYNLADESFELYVPGSYDGSEAYGLMVWINAGDHGSPPENFLPILDKHKLIWIGANRSGNTRSFWHRAGLALDGLHNAKQRFNIDPMRLYVSGISGGGRSASRVGLVYADEFAGAFSIIGTDYFKRLPHPDSNRNQVQQTLVFWAPAFNPPSPSVLRRAKRDGRYVLLTGETDGNRDQTLVTYEYGYKRAKFNHVTYLEVPGMGHVMPPAEWFDKGLAALDAPLIEIRERREQEAKKAFDEAVYRLSKSPQHGIRAMQELLQHFGDTTYADKAREALAKTRPIESKTDEVEPPIDPAETLLTRNREDLAMAKNYLAADRPDLAKPLLENVITRTPDSEEAATAQTLLDELQAD